MLKQLNINNYRSFQNFNISLDGIQSALILGKNGSGKSNLFKCLEVFQKIGQGITSVNELITDEDFPFNNTSLTITMNIIVSIDNKTYDYLVEIDQPEGFYKPKIKREIFKVNKKIIIDRDGGRTTLKGKTEFSLDWHHIGLPIITTKDQNDSIAIFKSWLANIIILSPNPALIQSISLEEGPHLKKNSGNLLDWLRHLLADHPNLYMPMSEFLKFRMPDFELFKFENLGKNSKELSFSFRTDSAKNLSLNFSQLSDGEKIYLLAATLIAKLSAKQPILCLWDEPNNFISLIELNHFIMSFRKAFENDPNKSQIIMSTHAPQVITEFSSNNTFIFHRDNHFTSTQLELLSNKEYLSPTLVDAIENGEIL
ncbi:AAA family ATPase [Acinetobacter sp. C26M]|uniref:AAA family ATPase n=1 Tax=unclassified Acinetobacter TaxID=196816 RepID=UPI002036ADA5|nr:MULTISPECIES: AAA family ATPase [unclassified Acinetobacter]USA45918.1 AAA family ATPase [Acinetobacter sp. C26M]USA49401.1 AAA family ATPase [Acinetobacter sp. C26G]